MTRPAHWRGLVVLLAAAGVAAGWAWRPGRSTAPLATAVVERRDLRVDIARTGLLRPAAALVYRSPLVGRDAEITMLAPEGAHVGEGDLLVRLETTELERERDRLRQELRQVQLEAQVAEIDLRMAQSAVDDLDTGEGALTVEETTARHDRARRKRDRLKTELADLEPLMARGFLTRDEFARTAEALEQAEEELTQAARRAEVLTTQIRPRELEQATLQLAQKQAQRENVRARAIDLEARLSVIEQQIEGSTIYARRPGLVVYETFLAASSPRKVRVGDRVSSSQGIVTIPEVARMIVETSVSERDLQRLRGGQTASIHLEAFPDRVFSGVVATIGALARQSASTNGDEKRFDVVVDVVDAETADLRPELTARVDVRVANRPAAIVLPIAAVFGDAAAAHCLVVGTGGVERRVITLGEANDTFVEVLTGLAEGERVSLAETTAAAVVAAPAAAAAPAGRRLTDVLSERRPLAPR